MLGRMEVPPTRAPPGSFELKTKEIKDLNQNLMIIWGYLDQNFDDHLGIFGVIFDSLYNYLIFILFFYDIYVWICSFHDGFLDPYMDLVFE